MAARKPAAKGSSSCVKGQEAEMRDGPMQRTDAWMHGNLTTQGYCLSDAEIASGWLLGVGSLLAAGATTAGLILGGALVAACATVTATNLCLPPEAFAWWARHSQRKQAITT